MTGDEQDLQNGQDAERLFSLLQESQRVLNEAEEQELAPRYERVQATLSTWVRDPSVQVDDTAERRHLSSEKPFSFVPPEPSRVQQVFGWAFAALAVVGFVMAVPHVFRAANTSTVQSQLSVEYFTHRAQRAELSLPDGSHVILAPESRLTYRDEPGGGRSIELVGQAYFAVTHDSKRLFTVRSGSSVTRVLGTTFIVRSYPGDSIAQVAVAEGKVSLESGRAPMLLLAGDVGHVAAGETASVIHNATIADVFGWTRGQLMFDNALLRDVIVELNRTYDLDIRLTDAELGKRRITAVFSDQSAADMLIALTGVADMKYERVGSRIMLSPQ